MNLNKLTVKELRAKCKEYKLNGYSKLRKQELIELLQQGETQRELQEGTALMEKIAGSPTLDSIAAVEPLYHHPHHKEKKEKRHATVDRDFLGKRAFCKDCGSLDIAISNGEDWCAECGSENLALRTPFVMNFVEAKRAVDAALFGSHKHFDSNYQAAIMVCNRLAHPRRVRASRKVA